MSGKLEQLAHRPWPLPAGPWVMAQTWHDLLFAHWPVPIATLRPHIPTCLAIDTFEGQAWLAVVPFRMSGVRLRGTPAPWLSAFPELNVRTYVAADGKPGVWFFSLDAGNPLAVAIARAWFHLPYFRARMSCEERNDWIEYKSERTHRHHPPWPLQVAEAKLERNTMADSLGVELPSHSPLLHFARRQDVLVWAPRRVR